MNDLNSNKVRLIASPKTWIEGNALSQLRGTAELPGMELAVGFPDLHPGKSGPVGAAFVTRDVLYPHLIGNDIGCGMGLWLSELKTRKLKLDRWANKLVDLDLPWDGDREKWLEQFQATPDVHDESLGTIGGGNHFAELQQVERIEDVERFTQLGLDEDQLVVLVHSGSRGLGKEVVRGYQEKHGYDGIHPDSGDARKYLSGHDNAVKWGKANRALIAARFLAAIGSDARPVLDLPHNFVAAEESAGVARPEGRVAQRQEAAPQPLNHRLDIAFAEASRAGQRWIHRKGANPSSQGALVIPGSRGALSYLVLPVGNQDANAQSLSHGAGRKWNRHDCRSRLRDRFDEESLQRTDLGSRVICEDRDLLYEEAPQAYKDIATVVKDLVDAGLVSVIATLRPLITYKLRRAIHGRKD